MSSFAELDESVGPKFHFGGLVRNVSTRTLLIPLDLDLLDGIGADVCVGDVVPMGGRNLLMEIQDCADT